MDSGVSLRPRRSAASATTTVLAVDLDLHLGPPPFFVAGLVMPISGVSGANNHRRRVAASADPDGGLAFRRCSPFHLGNPLPQLLHQLGAAGGELPIDALHLERVDDMGSVVDELFSFMSRQMMSLSIGFLPKLGMDLALVDVRRRVDAPGSAEPRSVPGRCCRCGTLPGGARCSGSDTAQAWMRASRSVASASGSCPCAQGARQGRRSVRAVELGLHVEVGVLLRPR